MFELVPMTPAFAERVDGWRYDPPYDFYDLRADPDDREAFLDPDGWAHTRAVLDAPEGSLVGFFQFDPKPGALEVGLGMAPAETGRGRGREFVETGLRYARERYAPEQFVLSVATFNERAIAVYEGCGFERVETFTQATNGDEYAFVRMRRPVEREPQSTTENSA
jgi:ribosomal-protein-alanine N-acetyltransferase